MRTGNGRALERLFAADRPGEWPDEAAWRAFVEHVAETLDVGPGTSVLDVGCGAGAFLFPLWENGYTVGGIDPSEALVTLARSAMPDGAFTVGAPRELHPAEAWHVVLASRNLAGLATVDDARAVIARMVAKATHAVALLDIVDEGAEVPGRREWLLRMLTEAGVAAVQFETVSGGHFHVFAQV